MIQVHFNNIFHLSSTSKGQSYNMPYKMSTVITHVERIQLRPFVTNYEKKDKVNCLSICLIYSIELFVLLINHWVLIILLLSNYTIDSTIVIINTDKLRDYDADERYCGICSS